MRYSYRCPECGVFTIEQSMKDEPIGECPDCGKPVKRIIGKNINVIYRTSGFYCTDKGGSCSESSSASEPGAASACEHCEAHLNS
ncbi:MAG: hypothetical protein FWG28_00325 [Clostridiales bacterium]|nr:hypothetical protein [Clostridiales bacterium]